MFKIEFTYTDEDGALKCQSIETETEEFAIESRDKFLNALEVRKELLSKGIPALKRLMVIAEKASSGQCFHVQKFLLALYNSYTYQFDLHTFRVLDKAIFEDCLLVLKMDTSVAKQEVHEYFENGNARFQVFAANIKDE